MSNLIALQNRVYFQGVFINDNISRFQIILNGIHYHNFVTGVMTVFWLLIIIGRIVNSQPVQIIEFSGKIVMIIFKAISWGVFG